jgi:hypothetical protein
MEPTTNAIDLAARVFTHKHLSERVGIIVRLNAETASIAVNDSDGHWHVSYALLRKNRRHLAAQNHN